REYVIQRNESDFDFISRLLGEEGIGFAIHQADQEEEVHFFKDSTSLPTLSGGHILADRDSTQLKHDTVSDLSDCHRGAPGTVVLRDYDFKRPSLDLTKEKKAPQGDTREVYLHPGNFTEASDGERLAAQTLERYRVFCRQVSGKSDCPRIEHGKILQVESHPRGALNGEFLVVSVIHRADLRATDHEPE